MCVVKAQVKYITIIGKNEFICSVRAKGILRYTVLVYLREEEDNMIMESGEGLWSW